MACCDSDFADLRSRRDSRTAPAGGASTHERRCVVAGSGDRAAPRDAPRALRRVPWKLPWSGGLGGRRKFGAGFRATSGACGAGFPECVAPRAGLEPATRRLQPPALPAELPGNGRGSLGGGSGTANGTKPSESDGFRGEEASRGRGRSRRSGDPERPLDRSAPSSLHPRFRSHVVAPGLPPARSRASAAGSDRAASSSATRRTSAPTRRGREPGACGRLLHARLSGRCSQQDVAVSTFRTALGFASARKW